ncbi:dihydrofolate reductase [Adhaeribacter sp. BT258]|uniref:Dihydrofolate reductase n=1 Tax=Adhaeribacter terrigena TaxID=2793070 RepID=A0ABS1C0Z3_9BACT|nr:dihydrofolate reductase family protein [Adhaeribacter terrigena]MBK0402998.1 dihydrofolate reductase [Adhaeribacter terrigena]
MRQLKLYIATSLDGKIARPNDAIDWLPPLEEYDYGYAEFMESVDAIVMGYKTYEVCIGLGEWPYKDKASCVFSRNPDRKLIPEAQLITQDPVEFIKQLKQTDGKAIWLLGGGEIIALLHDAGLIDAYILAYIPVILGEGIELFPGIKRQENLNLSKHQVYENGVTLFYFDKP